MGVLSMLTCRRHAFIAVSAFVIAASAEGQLPSLVSRPALEIGVLDGREEEVFGRIGGIAVDSAGNLFVLDDQSLDVRWFAPDGSFRGRAGGAGSGPGELRTARSIALDSRGRVHVLDPANGRISAYRAAESGLIPSGQVEIPQWATSMCILGDRFYILASAASGAVIQELDGSGRVFRSFGIPVPADAESLRLLPEHSSLLTAASNRGRLVCDRGSDRIVLVHLEVPIVRAFSLAGEEVWRSTIREYHAIRYRAGSTPRSIARGANPETSTAHTAAAAVVSDRGELIITLHEGSLQNTVGRLEGLVFDVMTGDEIGRRVVPIRVASVRGNRVVGYAQDPYSQVRVYQSGPR